MTVSLHQRWVRFTAVLAVVGLLVGGAVVASQVAQAAVTGTAGEYVSAQARLMDSRSGLGGYTTPFPANTTRTLLVAGQGGIPASGATAVEVTLTAIDPTVQGVVSGGADGGSTTALMVYDGNSQVRASNTAIIPVASDGKIQLSAQSTVNLLVDLQGYYTNGNGVTAPGGYSPVAGALLADTRSGTGVPKGGVGPGGALTIHVSGNGGVPTGAAAAFVSITTIDNGGMTGWYTPYASDQPRPATSVNIPPDTVPNATGLQVQLSASGTFTIYMGSGLNTDYVVSVEGYFTSGSSTGSFTPAAGRLLDSRVSPHVAVQSGQTITVPVGGQQGIPSTGDGLESAAVNVTLMTTNQYGHVVAWADGTVMPANYAQLYSQPGTVTNLINVPVGTDGAIEIYNGGTGPMDVVVDLEGFYQATNSTLCAKDTDTISGAAATSSATIGADQGSPVVSAMVTNSLAENLNAEVYVVDGSGNSVSGSPAESGTISSGEPLVYHLPTDNMTVGASYTWWIHVYQSDGCASQATSTHHTFTLGATPSTSTPTTSTLAITGNALGAESAPTGNSCSGSPCPLVQNALAVGNDGTLQHISAIKANLASIPAGARITAATLNLTPTCYASSCMSGTLQIAEANTDTAAAASGADIAAIETQPAAVFTEDPATTSYDITSMVQDWYDGSNNGAVLTETNSNSGASGESFAGPSDTTLPASITITYQAATIPDAVTNLTTTSGDGGIIAAWAPPAQTGWYDNTGAANGITNYSVTVTQGTTAVSSQTTTAPRAVITGLTNGTSYTVSVAATNPVGAGASVTSQPTTPAAVTGGPSKYIADTQDLLTAQDKLQSGAAQSTQDATAGATDQVAVSAALGVNATALESVYANEAASQQSETTDSTSLSNTLVVQTGSTVTVYTTATENFTTADTSTGSEVDVAGSTSDASATQFTSSTISPTYVTSLDAAGALEPVTPTTGDTLSAPPPDTGNTTSSLTQPPSNPSGTFTVNTSLASAQPIVSTASSRVNQNGIANWAYNKGTWWNWDPLFGNDDCTDFVSRAMHFGGGLSEVIPARSQWANHDSNSRRWYDVGLTNKSSSPFSWGHYYSKTWSVAPWSYSYQISRGGRLVSRSSVRAGDIAYVNFYGSSIGGIDHAAIVTRVVGNNPYVAQMSNPQQAEPIWKVHGRGSWQSSYSKMTPFFVDTSGER